MAMPSVSDQAHGACSTIAVVTIGPMLPKLTREMLSAGAAAVDAYQDSAKL
jgi:hypothetical protein